FEKYRVVRNRMVATVTAPTTAAAAGNPTSPIAATHSGEKITPPTLDPLYAHDRAAGRRRTNQGATSALTAAPLIVPQPHPLTTLAANSCHGCPATAQQTMPPASAADPKLVTRGNPKRRWRAGKFATTSAPANRCTVTAADTSGRDQPRAITTACRWIGGP